MGAGAGSVKVKVKGRGAIVAVIVLAGCSPGEGASTGFGSAGTVGEGQVSTSGGAGDASSHGTSDDEDDTAGADASGSGGAIFDVGSTAEGGDDDDDDAVACKVGRQGQDALPPCEQEAPANSFEPDVQWSFVGPAGERQSAATPLVANLTDDNGDGEIDLCDTPDIVLNAFIGFGPTAPSTGYVLDGATGAVHFELQHPLISGITPALGDLDGDGLAEIVAVGGAHQLVVFEHDGAVKWSVPSPAVADFHSLAIADLDADGSPEILVGYSVVSADGELLFTAPDPEGPFLGDDIYSGATPTAADLDDDGDLELVLGRSAYHHDGEEHYFVETVTPGFPAVGDLDEDGRPEVLVSSFDGLSLLEDDGTVRWAGLMPTGDGIWLRPATIHDFDGDGVAEFAAASAGRKIAHYGVYEGDASEVWISDIVDEFSGAAGSTAFDFLGDGSAEAMYADQTQLHIFDDAGESLLSVPRSSFTSVEYPVVADVDNDGSAEILVVSNDYMGNESSAALQVIRDVEDRWVPARRIWNQHTYHVTNVREDGTIPTVEPQHWQLGNTFRTQAQVEDGLCLPPEPEG